MAMISAASYQLRRKIKFDQLFKNYRCVKIILTGETTLWGKAAQTEKTRITEGSKAAEKVKTTILRISAL